MKAVVSFRIKNKKVFFGPGTRELLERIGETSSLRHATEDMGLSYTKALRMLKDMRDELGFDLVISEKGGQSRGKTTLTDKGYQVLNTFKEMDEKVSAYAQKLLDENFIFDRKEGTE